MAKVHLANYEPQRTGGGWSFSRNFVEGMGGNTDYETSDIYFIAGPTLASHEQVEKAKQDGKKIVLRLDNAVRDSRNRGTGMTRMKAFCDVADLVVYQSQWAKDFLMPFLKKDGVVILNGVDTEKFNAEGRVHSSVETYLYARSSRDEGKQWIMAWYWFVNNPGQLEIVGKFSGENLQYNFDFYNAERYIFSGELDQRGMVQAYKRNKYFLYSYTCEAGSNTLLEARASGCDIVNVFNQLDTGCGPEYMALEDISLERMIREYEQQLSKLT